MTTKLSIIAMLLTIAVGCRKNTDPVIEQPLQSANGMTVCSTDDWDLASYYNTATLVWTYNNKLYAPDYQSQTVKIYDGSSWTDISSPVPIATYSSSGNYIYRNLVFFTLGSKGYMLVPWRDGDEESTLTGFWEYNFSTNVWRKRANFPGQLRYDANYFSIGNKGYVVSGHQIWDDEPPIFDTWEYNPTTNAWRTRAPLPYLARSAATGFSIGNKGYIVCGEAVLSTPGNIVYTKELREYDPATNTWTAKAPFPGQARKNPSAFVIDDKAYVGGGPGHDDFYRYNPSANSWSRVSDIKYPYLEFFGFTINSTGYVVSRINTTNVVIKYTPSYCVTLPTVPTAP